MLGAIRPATIGRGLMSLSDGVNRELAQKTKGQLSLEREDPKVAINSIKLANHAPRWSQVEIGAV